MAAASTPAFKLATALLTRLEGIRRAYLIAAADFERFEVGQVSEVFNGPIARWRRHDTTQLPHANEAAWRHDLKHGRGRPAWIGVYRELVRKTGLSRDGRPGVELAVGAAVA